MNAKTMHSAARAIRHGAAGAALLLAALCLGPAAARAQDADTDRVEQTRTVLAKWVETRSVISKERSEWRLGRETLKDRIDIVRRSIESLRAKIADAEQNIAEAEGNKVALVAENDELQAVATALREAIGKLEQRVRTLLPLLPDTLRERLKPLSQQLPAEGAETRLGSGTRLANVLVALKMINKFNREITVTSEVRTLPDGTTAEVATLYLGLGQAFYVTQKGDAAGIGTVSDSGWVWTPANSAAPAIARAIAIHASEQEPDFVGLPVQIK